MDALTVSVHMSGELYCPRCENMFEDGAVCPRDGQRLVRLVAPPDLFVGRDLHGRFTIGERIGQGGMGAVYRARQHSCDREVAIKVVHPALLSNPDTVRRFIREAKLTSKLSHPNAIGVLDFGQTDDGVFYLAMELSTGKTLEEILETEVTLPVERVKRIGVQVCEALIAAHGLGIIHRDLKPSNLMLDARDFVKVLDFGLAKQGSGISSAPQGGESVLGTFGYLPPERLTGQPSDERGDLYSLGCTLYRAATGRIPIQNARQRAAPATALGPLSHVLERLMALDPEDRYRTAQEALNALESSDAEPAETAVSRDGATVTLSPVVRPRRWMIAALAAVAIAAIVALRLASSRTGDVERVNQVVPPPPTVAAPVARTPPASTVPVQAPPVQAAPVRPVTPPAVERPVRSTRSKPPPPKDDQEAPF